MERLDEGLIWALVFIFSTTCHEAAHAWVAKLGGDLTAYEGGQVTLNPIPHIRRSPFGMVVVPLLCFVLSGFMMGWASAPYNPHWAARYPKRSALMALAGPTANLILALLGLGAVYVLFMSGFFRGAPSVTVEVIANLLEVTILLNVILCVFNLIPLPPLDGAEAILLFFPTNSADQVRNTLQQVGFFGIFIAWIIMSRITPFLVEVIRWALPG